MSKPLVAICAVLLVFGLPSGVASADPAGPTDYRSEVLSVDPPSANVSLAVLGGDSFLELTVEPGTEVVVVGYRGEEYLWFRPDGTVLENQNSPSTYLNAERYGTEFPDFATPDAEPDWKELGTEGRWSWHDHRAHLMQPVPPFGTEPGDRILEAVVPLLVDGEEVDVTVISTWLPEPSSVPVWAGALVGAAAAALAFVLARRDQAWPIAVAVPALIAAGVGWWQYRSLPAETGPRLVWWLPPILAAVAALVALVPMVRRDRLIAGALGVLAGAQLVMWGYIKRDGLTAAIVPTDAPNWVDRATTMGALVGGALIVLGSAIQLTGTRMGRAAT